MEYGKVFARLRKDRNLTQTDVSKEICSRTTLASFEKHGRNISLEKTIQLLNKINVSLEEFFIHAEDYGTQEKKQLSLEIIEVLQSKKSQKIKVLSENLAQKFQKTHDQFYSLNRCYLLLLAHQNKFYLLSSETKESCLSSILTHLDNVESWGKTELSLFNNLMFCFETPFITNVLMYSEKRFKILEKIPSMETAILTVHLNAITLFIQRNEYEIADTIHNLMKQKCPINKYDLFHKLLAQFQENILIHKKTQDKSAAQQNQQILELLEALNAKDLLQEFLFLNTLSEEEELKDT